MGSPSGIKTKVLDCSLKVSKFKLQSCYSDINICIGIALTDTDRLLII